MNTLSARRLAIDTYQEHVAYMRHDCPVCASEGFEAQSRLQLVAGDRTIIATLNVVMDGLLGTDEIGLSEAAWRALGGARRLTRRGHSPGGRKLQGNAAQPLHGGGAPWRSSRSTEALLSIRRRRGPAPAACCCPRPAPGAGENGR